MSTFLDSALLVKIEKYCKVNGLDYIDGIVSYCEKHSIEVEVVAALIKKDPVFTAKLLQQAENLNFVKKSKDAKLPL